MLASIAFGALGPVQHRAFRDGTVQVEVAYRTAHGRERDRGEGAAVRSIAAGTLTLTGGGRRSVIDLATLFPIREDHIVLADAPPSDGCGLVETFARRGRYLAVEAVVAQKGCAPIVSFVDIETRKVIQSVVIDHSSEYRYDAEPSHFVGVPLRVHDVERITLKAAKFDKANRESTVSWPFPIVHAVAVGGAEYDFAFDPRYNVSAETASSMAALPTIGSRITIGTVVGENVWSMRIFTAQRLVRLSGADEKRYAARLPTTSPQAARLRRYNSLFSAADYAAEHGDFDKAVDDLATMLTLNDDPRLFAGDSTNLAACRRLQREVKFGALSERAASASFAGGCRVPRSR